MIFCFSRACADVLSMFTKVVLRSSLLSLLLQKFLTTVANLQLIFQMRVLFSAFFFLLVSSFRFEYYIGTCFFYLQYYILLPVPEFCLIKTDSFFSIPVLASLVLCTKTTNRRLNRSEFKKLKIEDCYLYWHFMVATSAYLFAKFKVHTHYRINKQCNYNLFHLKGNFSYFINVIKMYPHFGA